MPDLFYEDFSPGTVETFHAATAVTKDEILDFARQFDPQPFHLDEEAAKHSLLGGLSASGWHTCSLAMRLNFDGWIHRTASMGAPGIEEVRWLKPLRPGTRLQLRLTVLDKRVSNSRPDMGLVDVLSEVASDDGTLVMTQRHTQLVTVRAPTGERVERPAHVAGETPPAPPTRPPAGAGEPFAGTFEDIVVGASRFLGQETLTREAIVAFARQFDPQPFHIDEEAARASHFGSLTASGWHTAALWMRHVIARRFAYEAELRALGRPAPGGGPSPGFTKLRWIKPVHAGDTLSFASRVIEKRVTSRPGWGLIFSDNSATNQDGTRVFEFRGSAFMPMRDSASQTMRYSA